MSRGLLAAVCLSLCAAEDQDRRPTWRFRGYRREGREGLGEHSHRLTDREVDECAGRLGRTFFRESWTVTDVKL